MSWASHVWLLKIAHLITWKILEILGPYFNRGQHLNVNIVERVRMLKNSYDAGSILNVTVEFYSTDCAYIRAGSYSNDETQKLTQSITDQGLRVVLSCCSLLFVREASVYGTVYWGLKIRCEAKSSMDMKHQVAQQTDYNYL